MMGLFNENIKRLKTSFRPFHGFDRKGNYAVMRKFLLDNVSSSQFLSS